MASATLPPMTSRGTVLRQMAVVPLVQIPESFNDLLFGKISVIYGTVAGDGGLRAVPVWFIWKPEEGVVLLSNAKSRHNYRFVQRRPTVSLLFLDARNMFHCLQLRGVVENMEDDPHGVFYKSVQERYLRLHVGDGVVKEREAVLPRLHVAETRSPTPALARRPASIYRHFPERRARASSTRRQPG